MIESISNNSAQENLYNVNDVILTNTQEKLTVIYKQNLKKSLNLAYVQIKKYRRERFRLRETIDLRDMEIDDIKFEIDKLKTTPTMRLWNY